MLIVRLRNFFPVTVSGSATSVLKGLHLLICLETGAKLYLKAV